jgi:L-aminopeptidase/D-esterase-like protein
MIAGPRNLITDVAGLLVGNAEDRRLKSGTTVVVLAPPAVASAMVLGGAPGTRETDLLEPHNSVPTVDAIFLSGGSAFGLDAGTGVQAALREAGRGFAVGPVRVPIVPGAILFDLLNGGDKEWGRYSPYRDLGYDATTAASAEFQLGSYGAGTGALTAGLKGGLGSASAITSSGLTVGALVAVNPLGTVTFGAGRHFRAAAHEIGDEFGGLGLPHPLPAGSADIVTKMNMGQPRQANTTIGIVATDAVLTKAECKRLAMTTHGGFARAIWPSHTPMDGDIVFALSTGQSQRAPDTEAMIELCAAASAVMARAIARGVYCAHSEAGDLMPSYANHS